MKHREMMEELWFKRCWPRIILMVLLLLADSQNLNGQMLSDAEIEADLPSSGMQLIQQDNHVVMNNGIVSVTLTVPGGTMTNITYKGSDNLLETQNEEDDRGYWDVIWRNAGDSRGTPDKLQGSSFKVIVENEDQIEISFFTNREIGNRKTVPLNVDKRYIMLRNSSGFYTYAILEKKKAWRAFIIQEGRITFKLQENKFHYMAVSDERQRIMPTQMDRKTGKVLDYKEAVLLTNPSNSDFKNEVDDKYFYTCENKDNKVHGWISNDTIPVGMWTITPSNEFRTGGPFKQDLTSHLGPTMLSKFISRHYGGEDLAIKFENEEHWKKVLGPVYIYINSDASAKTDPSFLWKDAKQRMFEEEAHWPYSFPLSTDFLKSSQRGAAKGQLFVHDNKQPVPAASAYVGLALPGDAGSWQLEKKGYQFWTQTDARGNFLIKNVLPGTYNLFASVNGSIGNYKYDVDVIIEPGTAVNIRNVTFVPSRIGPTLWEIGIPDRTAAEFYIPDPPPQYKIHHYKGPVEKFKEYGLWKRYTDLYPQKDLVFTIGESDYTKDWFFAQVTRDVGDGNFQATTWEIHFDLNNVTKGRNYTLQLALASAHVAELQVRFNGKNGPPYFTTGRIGMDNAVARHGIHGLYRLYSIGVDGSRLVEGKNIVFLTQALGLQPFREVMYDYIRLEGPA